MPSKADFQMVVDWATQPPPNPLLARSIGAHLLWTAPDEPDRAWEGNLVYIPPHASRWWPEHFQGVLRRVSARTRTLNLALAVGDTYAVAGLGTYEEYDIDSVDAYPSLLWASVPS